MHSYLFNIIWVFIFSETNRELLLYVYCSNDYALLFMLYPVTNQRVLFHAVVNRRWF